jgi:steroid delta-isomerase-like uncharacterized protein
MTEETDAVRTNWDAVDPAEHVRRSAATFRVVKDMEDALATDPPESWIKHFHEDLAWRGNAGSGVKNGFDEFLRNWVAPLYAAFDDRSFTTERFIADGDWAACTGVLEATHTGSFMGIPATGRRVRIRYFDIWHVRDGRIADNPVFVDLAAVLQQLGRDPFAGEGWEAFDRGEREAPPL